MLFLIGMDKQAEFLMPLLTCHCHRCGRDTQWQLWKEVEKASLFFIKIWTFTPDYLLVCEECRDNLKLPRDLGKAMLEVDNRDDAAHQQMEALIADHQSRSRVRP